MTLKTALAIAKTVWADLPDLPILDTVLVNGVFVVKVGA